MKRFLLLAAMQATTLMPYSQEISLGETVPDISLGEFFHTPKRVLSLGQLKGKIVIFDFWNVRCSACMVDMPRLDSLQTIFGDKIQIILVTQNSALEVDKLFNKIAIPIPRLPMIINDTILYKMFPHTGDPFHAWVDRDGKLAALTNHDNTNNVTVANALMGQPINLPRRYNTTIDPGQLLVSEQNKMVLQLSYYHSVLFRNMTSYSTGEMVRIRNSQEDGTGITTVNTTIPVLYHVAYNYSLFGMEISSFDLRRNNRIVFETSNPNQFLRPSEVSEVTAWEEVNKLSYELNVPASDSDLVYQYMQQDLNRYLPFEARLEKRLVKCLALVRTDEIDKLKAEDSTILPSRKIDQNRNISIKNMTIKNAILKSLMTSLSFLTLPIIDATNYRGRIDIVMKSNLKTVDEFRAQLIRHGLDLVEMDKEILMLVIRDKKHKTTD